jgi:tetratricopeptide (TPR) repeat protein
MDALKSQKEPEKANETHSPKRRQSFGGRRFSLKLKSKPVSILVGVLGVVVVSSVGWELFKAGYFQTKTQTVVKKAVVSPIAEEPLSVTMEKAATLYQQNRLDESLQLYQKAVGKNPDNARLHNDIGLIMTKKGLYADAEKQLLLAVSLAPDCAECQNNLGYLKTLVGQTIEAEQCFIRAINLNADYADPYFNLGVLYEKNGDIGNALSAYQEFTRHSPDKNSLMFLQVENRILLLMGR